MNPIRVYTRRAKGKKAFHQSTVQESENGNAFTQGVIQEDEDKAIDVEGDK